LAFDNGLHYPKLRPSAETWGKTIYDIVNSKTTNTTFLSENTENILKNRIQKIKELP
jgi:hypothetical protein